MSIQVVSVYTPRPGHPKWYDYVPLLRAQRDSARWFGHGHLVVTDTALGEEFHQLRTNLPAELMPAMISGVIARLRAVQYATEPKHLVFVDCDCLIVRDLTSIFEDGWFDLGLTHRDNSVAPINNGVMYVHSEGVAAATRFFEEALEVCGTHWGADQEAISQVAAPVPEEDGTSLRKGCRIAFMNMRRFAAVPKAHLSQHGSDTYVVHFKGNTKEWMLDYANEFIFQGAPSGSR